LGGGVESEFNELPWLELNLGKAEQILKVLIDNPIK
jgi:hypothetical protein